MDKREANAIIYLLCLVLGILFVLLAYVLLRLMTVDASLAQSDRQNRKNREETQRATMLLRDEREKFERLLKALQPAE